jgi:Zn-finger nucleic acid-binding protein
MIRQRTITEAKLICPECSAMIVTSFPEAVLWERCPECGTHVWDIYDLMMAETVSEKRLYAKAAGVLS